MHGDYVDYSAILVFAPGETQKTVPVHVLGDKSYEADETFYVRLTNVTNASPFAVQGQVTILNDDAPPSIIATAPTLSGSDVAPGPAIARAQKSIRLVFNVPVLNFTLSAVKLYWSPGANRPPVHATSLRGAVIRKAGADGAAYTLYLPRVSASRRGAYRMTIGGVSVRATHNAADKMTTLSTIYFRRA